MTISYNHCKDMTMVLSFQILRMVFIRQNSSSQEIVIIYLLIPQRNTKIIRQNSSRLSKCMNQVGFQRMGIFLAIKFLVGASFCI